MTITRTYRILALSLAVSFGIFNVGIPVVLATCPMTASGVACFCLDEGPQGTQTIKKQLDSSCCKTVIAADRNTNEFLQIYSALHELSSTTLSGYLSPAPTTPVVSANIAFATTNTPSPPGSGDIPVFISSLLI